MAPCPILDDVCAARPQIREYGFETGLGLGVLMRGIVDDRIHQVIAEIAVDGRAQSLAIGLRYAKVGADRVGELVSRQVAGEAWRFGRNVERGESLQIVLMVPVDGAAAVEHANLDHALGTYALQRLVHRSDEFRILVNVNDGVGARRRSVAAADESQLDVPYTKNLIRQRARRTRHVNNARHRVSAPRPYGHNSATGSNFLSEHTVLALLIQIPRHALPRRALGRADIARRRLEDVLPRPPLQRVRHALERAAQAIGRIAAAAAALPAARLVRANPP